LPAFSDLLADVDFCWLLEALLPALLLLLLGCGIEALLLLLRLGNIGWLVEEDAVLLAEALFDVA
jgi:hypothetical protein